MRRNNAATLPPDLSTEWSALAAGWAQLWQLPDLEGRVTLKLSSRLRTSLGRCAPARGEVRIAPFLLEAPRPLLREVLCHEAAHAAAHLLHQRRLRPHGPEWRGLMHAAGFEPRVRLPREALAALPERVLRRRGLWEHRCPVCHAVRLAGRPVPQWRCAECRAAGLEGLLVIARDPAAAVAGT